MSNNQYLIDILSKGSEYWNSWRLDNSKKSITIDDINFRGQSLKSLDLHGADLGMMDFTGADLCDINLQGANLFQADFREAHLESVDFSSANLTNAYLNNLDLRSVTFVKTQLDGANIQSSSLQEVNLEAALLRGTNLYYANLEQAHLYQAALHTADLSSANLAMANLNQAGLIRADLSNSDLTKAELIGAELGGAWLRGAKLCRANLTGAKLVNSQLSNADFEEAILVDCWVHGISAWEIKNLDKATQKNLIITRDGEPIITVDDLEIAQFIHILLNNRKIRRVIDTITSKVVLILGRFTNERKAVLDALRDELRKRNYSPIIFDSEPSPNRDLTETVYLLASMSRFIIADLTAPRSIPQELSTIIPNLASVAVQPILQRSDREQEYAMFEHFKRYPWVLKTYDYSSQEDLIALLVEKVIEPSEAKVKELRQLASNSK